LDEPIVLPGLEHVPIVSLSKGLKDADIVVLALQAGQLPSFISTWGSMLGGKVVLDVSNPWRSDLEKLEMHTPPASSLSISREGGICTPAAAVCIKSWSGTVLNSWCNKTVGKANSQWLATQPHPQVPSPQTRTTRRLQSWARTSSLCSVFRCHQWLHGCSRSVADKDSMT
jgi:hypothetical protein